MNSSIPCECIAIYASDTGVSETQEYPGFLDPMEMGHDLVRIEGVSTTAFVDHGYFGDRVDGRDWPYFELDLTISAARRLADALREAADQSERAPKEDAGHDPIVDLRPLTAKLDHADG